MNRRTVLGALGAVGSLGIIGYTTRDPVETLEARFWISRQAATYGHVVERITSYLSVALDLEFWTLDLTYGGVVDVSTEHSAKVTRNGEWPRAVITGFLGRNDIEPAADVNLLVTDWDMRQAPTGYAVPHLGSVGGARYLDALDALEYSKGSTRILPATRPNWVLQVLVHEVGHMLGLSHDHGVLFRRDGVDITTPMLSTYAWSSAYTKESSRCGDRYPRSTGETRKYSIEFSECARETLETYAGFI